MTYEINVTIYNPTPDCGMPNSLDFELKCSFVYDEYQYGNGHYVSISGKSFEEIIYDLRYDKSFDRNNKVQWLVDWLHSYWSGENGSYKVLGYEISHT